MRCETATTETRRRRGIRSYRSWELNPGGDVMVGIVVLVVCGLALVVGVVLIMTRLDRRGRREFQRRRDAWGLRAASARRLTRLERWGERWQRRQLRAISTADVIVISHCLVQCQNRRNGSKGQLAQPRSVLCALRGVESDAAGRDDAEVSQPRHRTPRFVGHVAGQVRVSQHGPLYSCSRICAGMPTCR
jgi:hypothetical protein